jgi:hypothetical protein
MITEIPQPITCFISTKSEILSDYAAPCARVPRASLRTGLTVTTHHLGWQGRGYSRAGPASVGL